MELKLVPGNSWILSFYSRVLQSASSQLPISKGYGQLCAWFIDQLCDLPLPRNTAMNQGTAVFYTGAKKHPYKLTMRVLSASSSPISVYQTHEGVITLGLFQPSYISQASSLLDQEYAFRE